MRLNIPLENFGMFNADKKYRVRSRNDKKNCIPVPAGFPFTAEHGFCLEMLVHFLPIFR
jgi:hypothetical protein